MSQQLSQDQVIDLSMNIIKDSKRRQLYWNTKEKKGYQINNKDIMVHISDNITSWNVDYGGMPNYMQKCGKSIIQNKQIILAKSYREYYKFESDIELFSSKTSYFALYEKDDLYYFVTTSDISQKEFIQFLKEYII